MKIAVTGITGHLGSNLIPALLKTYPEATLNCLIRSEPPSSMESSPRIQWVKGNLLNKTSLETLCQDCDLVIHSAAQIYLDSPLRKTFYNTNVQGAQNMVEAASQSQVKRFVHISSIHSFEMKGYRETVNESSPRVEFNGTYSYDESKYAAEKEIRKGQKYGLEVVILNPTGIIGPADWRTSIFGKVILDIYHRKIPLLIKGAFNWVDVRDVVQSTLAAIERGGNTGENYILGGHSYSLPDLAALIGRLTGKKVSQRALPVSVVESCLPLVKFWCALTRTPQPYGKESLAPLKADPIIQSDKAKAVLGHSPRSTEETIKDLFSWFDQQGMLKKK